MAAGQRYAAGAVENDKEQSVVFRLHFILYARNRRNAGRERETGRKIVGGTLNYNPLRDTAEFTFKIKRA